MPTATLLPTYCKSLAAARPPVPVRSSLSVVWMFRVDPGGVQGVRPPLNVCNNQTATVLTVSAIRSLFIV